MGGASNSSTSTTKHKPGGAASLRADAFTVSIPKGMAAQAAKAAKSLGITRAQLVKNALAELLADIQDAKLIEQRRGEPSIPHDEFWNKVGLEG